MKVRSKVKNLVVLVTIMVFLVFTFSLSGKKKGLGGQIEVTASVEQAAVFIEGFNMGTPPLTIEDVPPGIYRVTVKAEGYDDFIEDVKVEDQTASKVDARMTEGSEGAKLPLYDYGFWDSLSKNEKKKLERGTYSSFLLDYQKIELANFEVIDKESVPHDVLFPFYSEIIKQLNKYTDFQQILVGYTDTRGMEELKKVCTSEKAAPGEKTLLLSGIVKKLKKHKNAKNSQVQSFQVSKNVGFAIDPGLIKFPPGISVVFRLTDKESGYVVYTQLISGYIYEVGEDFAKALKKAADAILKRKKEREAGN